MTKKQKQTRQLPPADWRTLLDVLALRDDDPARWARLRPEQRQHAEQFDRERAAGIYGAAWQSASERARTAKVSA